MTPSDPAITQRRAERYLDDVLRPSVYTDLVPLEVGVYQSAEPIPHDHAIRQEFAPVQIGWTWGPVWSTAWFRLRGKIPTEFGQDFRLLFDTRTEALCWWDGAPYQGVELHRNDVRLPASVKAGGSVEVFIEAACNHMLGVAGEYGDAQRFGDLPVTQSGKLKYAHIARYHADRAGAVVEFECLLDFARFLDPATPRGRRVNAALQDALAALSYGDLDESLPRARAIIKEALSSGNADDANTAFCIGNAHIDLAWLWPIRETKRKASRTFSTVLRYMERHPGYTFMQSQAQAYEWVRQQYPALFEQIKQRVKEGRWEAGGGTWVEPDCNLPTGESIVRQFLVGCGYFQKHFGVKQTYLWQPDVFGYSAALPQILRLAGLDVFFSQKISWNQYNKFPHHSFRWIGLDGTSVVSHFFPADTYIGNNLPHELLRGDKNYQQSGRLPAWLQAYGWGDGGGGPTEDQIQRVDVLADCAGLPKAKHSRVDAFAQKLLERQDQLPQWVGELYLELHRGTYTTQAFVKKYNRLGERLLQDVEVAQSLAIVAGRKIAQADRDKLDELWKLLLLNQFHDILPGSSINWVYKDAWRDYQKIMSEGAELLKSALSGEKTLSVLNTVGVVRSGVVEIPFDAKVTGVTQEVSDPHAGSCGAGSDPAGVGVKRRIACVQDVAPMSASKLQVASPTKVSAGDLWLENDHVRVELNALGQVVSLVHKASGRQSIPTGNPANQFVLYEDIPYAHDAWDVDLGYLDKAAPVTSPCEHAVVERGPVRCAIEFKRPLGKSSKMVQRVQLCADSAYVEFDTHVDWHESHQFLRVLHPIDAHADHATYEVQFGHLRRPNHFNTSWDYARFEVPAQRWMDLSETGFGVTLLNDCKYGHSCHGNAMGLSLLRSSKSPDAEADMGAQRFKYALMPHGALDPAHAIAAAEAINQPLRVVEASTSAPIALVPVGSGVILDTLKPAVDGDGLIVRLYESRGAHTSFDLSLHASIKSVEEVNLLEAPLAKRTLASHATNIELRPFQILSLRLRV